MLRLESLVMAKGRPHRLVGKVSMNKLSLKSRLSLVMVEPCVMARKSLGIVPESLLSPTENINWRLAGSDVSREEGKVPFS